MCIGNCHRLLTAEKQGEGKHKHASTVLQHGLWKSSPTNSIHDTRLFFRN